MITTAAHQNKPKLRITRKLGDLALWDGLQRSPNLKLFWENTEKAIFKTMNDWRQFMMGILASLMTFPLRICHGKNQVGLIMTVAGTSTLLAANSTHIWTGWAGFGVFFIPIIPFCNDWDQIYQWIYMDIRSIPLLAHTALYLISGLVNTILAYAGLGHDASKRGNSYLALVWNKVFARKRHKADDFVVSVFEIILVGSLGVIFWQVYKDYHYAVILWVIAFSELCQQLNDKAYQNRQEAILNA